MNKKVISIVVPCFNEEESILKFYDSLNKVIGNLLMETELIFVDDGSTDNTFELIKKCANIDARVKYIKFTRNFGHQKALLAGIEKATGSAIITIDADLQHPPELIPEMIQMWKNGSEIVNAIRLNRPNIPFIKKYTSKLFYAMFNKIAEIEISENSPDFRLIDRKVVEVIKKMHEEFLFLRGLIPWSGFKIEEINYEENLRLDGCSKYNLGKMISFAVCGVTSFSIKPLRISIFFSVFCLILCIIQILYVLYVYFFLENAVSGWSSITILISAIGAMILFILGVIGEYIGKLFIENKQRPRYIIKDEN